jgi:hypothetical protein
MQKIHAGRTTKYFMGDAYNANVYKWEQQPFCIRCGKPNVNYEGKR